MNDLTQALKTDMILEDLRQCRSTRIISLVVSDTKEDRCKIYLFPNLDGKLRIAKMRKREKEDAAIRVEFSDLKFFIGLNICGT